MSALFLSLCLAVPLPANLPPPAEPTADPGYVGRSHLGPVTIRGDRIRIGPSSAGLEGVGRIDGDEVRIVWMYPSGLVQFGVYGIDCDGISGVYWNANGPEWDFNETICWR